MRKMRRICVGLISVLLAICFTGCSTSSQDELTEPEMDTSSAPAETEDGAANTESSDNEMQGESRQQVQLPSFTTSEGDLVTPSGDEVTLSFPNVGEVTKSRVIGDCLENLALVSYSVGTYNEEWDSYDDETTHLGYVDGQGQLAFSLDEITSKYGTECSVTNWGFNEGVAAIELRQADSDSNFTEVILNSSGKEIYALGENERFVNGGSAGVMYGGVITISDGNGGIKLIDGEGQLLFENAGGDGDESGSGYYSGEDYVSVGLGYVMKGGGSASLSNGESVLILDYQGNTILDINSIVTEGAESVNVNPTGNVGIIQVNQTRGDSELYGLYSLPLNRWLIEPAAKEFEAIYANESTVAIAASKSDEFGMIDLEGDWVMGQDVIPKTRSGYEYLKTTFCSLGNGWVITNTDWDKDGPITGQFYRTLGLLHVDENECESVDCDVLIEKDLERDLRLPSFR